MGSLVRNLAVAAALSMAAASTIAQSWPARPIRWIVPYPPGGATEIHARLIADPLSKALGQPVVIDIRPGASGLVGSGIGAKSAPDGYTLVAGTSAIHAINIAMLKVRPYDPVTDFKAIIVVSTHPNAVAVHPSLNVKTFKELLDYFKANPGTPYASAGPSSSGHLTGELLKLIAKVDITHIPYKGGGQATIDLIAGFVKVGFIDSSAALPFQKSGQIRVIAYSGLSRSAAQPDMPTVSETLPGFDVSPWQVLFAPAGTPDAIVRRLNNEIAKILRLPQVKPRLDEMLSDQPEKNSPADAAAFVQRELVKWQEVVAKAAIEVQ